MPKRDIIVIGASAGGVEALQVLAATLPPTLPAAVFVVVHIAPRSRSYLPEILNRHGKLLAVHAVDEMPIELGKIYIAPPDHHLLLERDHMHLGVGPRENRHRPCINVMFRSAASTYGDRVVGVVLTGQLDDGTAGLWDVKRRGGAVIVQRPEDAMYPSMPLSALREVDADYTVSLSEIGGLLDRLARENGTVEIPVAPNNAERKVTDLTCPDCRGTLWESRRGPHADYECRIGHSFSARSMLAEHFLAQEKTMWQSVVALEEGAVLARRMADELEPDLREKLIQESKLAHQQAARIRGMLMERTTFGLDPAV